MNRYQTESMSFERRRATVLGFAREGVDLARFLVAKGARVLVTDRKSADELRASIEAVEGLPIEFVLGGHPIDKVLDTDVLFVSPGVPQDLEVIVEARRRGIEVSSATRLFLQLCPGRIVGITGSSGKSTTTALVGEILKADGRHVIVGGNIGVPLLGRLHELGPHSWVVMELSSFQLESVDSSPHVAVLTNISPNHLDRHGTMENYIRAKERILLFQQPSDAAVLNADDPTTSSLRPRSCRWEFSLTRPVLGAYLRGSELVVRRREQEETIALRSEVRLRGEHNLANVLAACAAAAAAGASVAAMRTAATRFTGLPHRLQLVAERYGVKFYNDSIATSPDRAIAGLRSFDEPVVLIAGGRDKHLPMEEWAQVVSQRVRHVVLLGEAADKLREALLRVGASLPIHYANSMEEAVSLASRVARPGEVVLLSPGCTSFDMFRDFEHRGEVFARCVHRLLDNGGHV